MTADEIKAVELTEQRHQLLDLDADSKCTDFPGCACVACPPKTVPVEET